jgi:hypothetical protein
METEERQDSTTESSQEIPEQQLQMALATLRSEQNLPAGIVAGLVAALGGSAIWALTTVLAEYQIGWMAIGVGLVVGFSVRMAGKGIEPIFGAIGAVLSLIGCLIGNLLTMTYFFAVNEEVAFFDALGQLNLDLAIEIMVVTFDYMDIVFYGIAVYFGYKYAFRQVTQDELNRALGKAL